MEREFSIELGRPAERFRLSVEVGRQLAREMGTLRGNSLDYAINKIM